MALASQISGPFTSQAATAQSFYANIILGSGAAALGSVFVATLKDVSSPVANITGTTKKVN